MVTFPDFPSRPAAIFTYLLSTSDSCLEQGLATLLYCVLGRCLQHRGGEPERGKGSDGMQLFALDCIADNVYAETDRVFACMNGM